MRDEDILTNTELVSAIYASVIDPVCHLRAVMDRFASEMRCDAAYFKLVKRPDCTVMAGVGGGTADGSDTDYLEHYLAGDVRVPRVDCAPRRKILDDGMLIVPEERRRSPFHHEWLARYDLEHLIHVNISPSAKYTAIVTCAQAPERGEFSARQRAIFSLYVPHFERAAILQIRMLELGSKALLVSEAFRRLTVAGLIVDGSGRAILVNQAADEILAALDGVSLSRGRLCIADPEASRAFSARLREAAFAVPDRARRDDTTPIEVRRPSGRRPYRLELLPLPGGSIGVSGEAAPLLALLDDPDRRSATTARTALARFGLTNAEARLAEAVAQGARLRDYADRRGVTIGTVRYQMKQVLAKTDCRRQADLVRLLNASS
jgi:DNA-binding CsgD family transcriptional regulator